MTSLKQVRDFYLEYFKSQGHAVVPSASLLPENDPSTLFTTAGMQPIIPYLMGGQHPNGKRIVNSQKCFRSQDVDEVGDNRHTTFFEMLGNWSLGDYFKKEQIAFVFDFLVNKVGLNPQNIYVTVFRGNTEFKIDKDIEAAEYWQNEFAQVGQTAEVVDWAETKGLQGGRIFFYDATKNWWSRSGVPKNMPVGELGGPDSEVFWDFGSHKLIHENSVYKNEPCHVNCDCGRFMEIGNSVFMQYLKTAEGFAPLPQKNIDFGGGLERICAAANNIQDIFQLDIFANSLAALENISGKKYDNDPVVNKSFRVILDHLRAATFLIADGATPSNKDQGYFTRRLVRRAVRYANVIGLEKVFTKNIVKCFVEAYAEVYPDLVKKLEFIQNEVQAEEEKFLKTIHKGLIQFNKIKPTSGQISGAEAFDLFTTHGFPLEMTEELASEQGLKVDKDEFYNLLKTHQDNSRTASAGKFKGGLVEHSEATTKLHTATHLTLESLKRVLNKEIQQKGSNITPERLRFDFNYSEKLTPEQLAAVESLVNEQISRALPVSFKEMTVDEAKAMGATGVFEHKYGDKVKVYTIGDFSKEICGGPHVTNTSELGHYKILKEEASSAGVRRIKAILE